MAKPTRRSIGTAKLQQKEKGECPYLNTCAFMVKYRELMEIYCMSMERVYCKGAKQQQCARLREKSRFGRFPSEDISPSGDKITTKG
ncbi:MAG: hypothetical protein K8R90_06170 [Candidatus Cloacimonetes bacterium]|nr:hypothetical protein [Candidatus Cloacimonadota bacterium]